MNADNLQQRYHISRDHVKTSNDGGGGGRLVEISPIKGQMKSTSYINLVSVDIIWIIIIDCDTTENDKFYVS